MDGGCDERNHHSETRRHTPVFLHDIRPLPILHTAAIRQLGSHGRLRQRFVGLRRCIAGAFSQSERFHDDSNLFGRSHVGGSGSHHGTDTDGSDCRLSNAQDGELSDLYFHPVDHSKQVSPLPEKSDRSSFT